MYTVIFIFQFNELMNQLDPNDDDSDSDRETKDKKPTPKSAVETPHKSGTILRV